MTETTVTSVESPLGSTVTASPHTLPSKLETVNIPGPNAQPASVVDVPEESLTLVEKLLKDLEGASDATLRNLYADALKQESFAKRDLYILRQRLANLATDSEEEEERLLSDAKKAVADALAYLRALQIKMGAVPTTPTTN